MLAVNLNLKGRIVFLLGGGRVGQRKLKAILAAGANVRVVEPKPQDVLLQAVGEKGLIYPSFKPELLDGVICAVLASSEHRLNQKVAKEAKARGILVNLADDPGSSDFTLPALVERGEFRLAISTGGASPALSAHVAARLRSEFGVEYGLLATLLKNLRPFVLNSLEPETREKIFRQVATNEALLKALAQKDFQGAQKCLQNLVMPLELNENENKFLWETLIN